MFKDQSEKERERREGGREREKKREKERKKKVIFVTCLYNKFPLLSSESQTADVIRTFFF